MLGAGIISLIDKILGLVTQSTNSQNSIKNDKRKLVLKINKYNLVLDRLEHEIKGCKDEKRKISLEHKYSVLLIKLYDLRRLRDEYFFAE